MATPAQSPRGLVLDIDRFAVHDGPGIRTAVFLKGCTLHCAWCHSPESQGFSPELIYMENKCTACGLCLEACPRAGLSSMEASGDMGCRVALDRSVCDQCGACVEVCYPGALKMSGEWWVAETLAAEVARDAPFFKSSGGGVTLSGGEASQQAEFALAFLAACKTHGLSTAIETNGAASQAVFERLAQVTDLFLFDLKQMDDAEHRRLTGASNRASLRNLQRLAELGAQVVVRVPCIPGLTDTPANLTATAQWMRAHSLAHLHLLPYNPAAPAKYAWLDRAYPLAELVPQTAEVMEASAALCRSYGLDVYIQA